MTIPATRRAIAVALLIPLGCTGDSTEDPEPTPATPPVPAAPAADAQWVVTPTDVGPIRIGWTVADLNRELGDSVKPKYEFSDECDYIYPAALPKGLALMVNRDTIVRVDVDSARFRTPEGVGIGDTEARVNEVYGQAAKTSPHHYTGPEGHDITVRDATDTTRQTIFETDGKVVVDFRAGRLPGVGYIEGCS
jgi:hypothetical protein